MGTQGLQRMFERKRSLCDRARFSEPLKNNLRNEKMLCQGDR